MSGRLSRQSTDIQRASTTNSDIVAAHTDPLSGIPGDMHDHGGRRLAHMAGSPATYVAQQQATCTPMVTKVSTHGWHVQHNSSTAARRTSTHDDNWLTYMSDVTRQQPQHSDERHARPSWTKVSTHGRQSGVLMLTSCTTVVTKVSTHGRQ